MKKYLSFFKIRFAAGIQYRAAAIAGIATQFAWGLMEIAMFRAFLRTDPAAFPMDETALYSYIWLQQMTLVMFMPWIFENSVFDSIRNGGVAGELTRPLDIYSMWFARSAASRISGGLLRLIPMLTVTLLLPKPFRLTVPDDPKVFGLFIVSVVLGFAVVLSFQLLVYISAFYTVSPNGVRILAAMVGEFCSGAVIPLPFMPDGVRQFLSLLPFASMQSTPFLIWGGSLTGADAVFAVLLQLFWTVSLVSLGKLWIRRALKRVVSYGG